MSSSESKEELSARFGRDAAKGQLPKAIEAALGGCVKRHVFLPSGRSILTVVGSNADEFIDPARPFCSCESYFYGVLGARPKYCYHLLSYKIASESGLVKEVSFDDQEFDTFVRLLASDVLRSRSLSKRREPREGQS